MADPRHFPEKQGGQYDAGGYYPDDQRDYPQSGYERREYINSGQTERSQYTSEGSTYGTDNYNYQQQHQQYGDQTNHGYSSPGYAPTDAYSFPAYSPEHEYSGGGYYSPPPLSPTGQPPPVSGQPPDRYYKSEHYDNYDNYEHYDPHTNVDNYQKPQFDVYSDFNNNTSPPPHDHEPSDAHTTYASSTRPFGASKENAELSDPMRNSIAAQRLPVKKQRRRCCRCCRCCTWKVCAITTFIVLIILAVVGFFVFPRVPKMSVVDSKGTDGGRISSTRIDVKFDLVVQVDNEANWIPFHFNKVEVKVFNRVATQPIGTGELIDYQLKPRTTSFIDFPLRIYYWGNDTDPVISDFISACGKDEPERTSLNLDTTIKLFIWGIDWAYKPTIRAGSSSVECPYKLPVGNLDPSGN